MKARSIFFVMLLSAVLFFATSPAGEDLTGFIERIVRESGVDKGMIGISIVDAKTGHGISSLNPDKMLNPASNIKLLTSYCAARELTVNYRWETLILTGSQVSDGAVRGDLYIKGNGDPYMVSENLWMMAKDLINRGISKIEGDLVLDSSDFIPFFEEEETVGADVAGEAGFASGFESDFDRSFTAYPSALSLNFNSVTIYVRPDKPGIAPGISIDPAIDYFVVENKAMTVADRKREEPKIAIEKLKDRTKIRIYGRWSSASKKVHYRKVFHPEIYFGTAFKKFFLGLGGTITGRIRLDKTPVDASKILSFESRPLSQVIWGLNKFSNNFMAVQLMLTLGAKGSGYPATAEKGLAALNRCFDSLNLRKDGNLIVSASGLSRKTRVSASQLASILVIGISDFQVGPEFTSSLGIYGDDGTVRKREFPSENSGLIRVKTGSLDGVDSIAGYIRTKKGNLLVFAVIENGFKESEGFRYRDFQNRLIRHIFEKL